MRQEIYSERGTADSMTDIHFTIPGKIVPKQSTRFYHGHAVPQKRVQEYAEKVKAAYMSEYPFCPLVWADKEPLGVVISIYMAVPKSVSKKRKNEMIVYEYPIKTPDLDNCCKSILDSCKGVIFSDDSQVVALRVNKFWHEEDITEVLIKECKK